MTGRAVRRQVESNLGRGLWVALTGRPIALRILGSVVSAILLIGAMPGNTSSWLVWICLVPWGLALRGATVREALVCSLVFSGLVWHVYLWVPFYDAAKTIASGRAVAVFLTATHLSSYALPFLLTGVVQRWFDNASVSGAAALAAFLTSATVWLPSLFEYNLATLLYEHPMAIQLLDLSGTSLLLWAIVFFNFAVRNLVVLCWTNRPVGKRHLLAPIVLLVIVFGYGYLRLDSDDGQGAQGRLRVASIQPNMGGGLSSKAMIRDNRNAARSYVELTRVALEMGPSPDLIVWPENGISVDCADELVSERISALAHELEVPIMHQCFDCSRKGELGGCFNQSRYVSASGETLFAHNKNNLVPLFEALPRFLRSSVVGKALSTNPLWIEGGRSDLFEHPKALIIPAVCFDAHSVELVRSGLTRGGQVLVVQSNDRIFQRSKIGLSDLAINVSSAVALRVPMAKVSNAGYGAFVQASGRIVPGSITPVDTAMASVYDLELEQESSLHRRFGNWFVYVSAAMFVVAIILRRAGERG